MRRLSPLVVVLILGLVAALAAFTSASADDSISLNEPAFHAEARAAGLTANEAHDLQERVDEYLAKSGGEQVTINKIVYPSGGNLLLSLPGEKYARELNEPIGTQATCFYGWFCAWKNNYYTGDKRSEFYCNQLISIPWLTWGSWQNNQTKGTIAFFLDSAMNPIGYTQGAPQALPLYNWSPVFYVDIC